MPRSDERRGRSSRLGRLRLLTPLAARDYRLLAGGTAISLLGDGVFLVALAWQVYALSDEPTALATIGVAMTVPTIACLLFGGAMSDRHDRRLVMLIADSVRALALGLLAVLSANGTLRLPELMAIAAVYGAGTAFFDPASDALVAEVVEPELLPQANSIEQLLRPLALRLLGPALGGVIVQELGLSWGFLLDAASFVVSASALLAMSPRRRTRPAAEAAETVGREILAGLRYVRRRAWLWVTLVSAAIAYLLFMGPTEVLLPFLVKNRMAGGAGDLGLVFAAGGVGSLACAITIGQRGLPRGGITFVYGTWAVATFSVAGYGLATGMLGLMVASIAFNTLETAGTIAWSTIKQRHVPAAILGRVSSLDWLISIGLLPISYALSAPVSAALGIRTTLILAGVVGGLVTIGALLVPGVRDLDRAQSSKLAAASAAP